ncbi:hypothetical protein BWQ96_10467 [Gracilariopsis chorda]|uniref:Uncharacterized protein n=1 Tax=Gracilariopsis chorda TaxID=448386 RepID=A0A2V3ICK4_9FLOR|nr:hypothetical protein BWQ96_10467 [Gracilariopsis chorda]|eukprot:PXF39826.1 hypothetical protein BWQ96_10467 [Gracilariopsis chorda]
MVASFKGFLVFLLHLVLLLNKVRVTGVPVLPKRAFKAHENTPSANLVRKDATSSSTQEESMDDASLDNGDILDRVVRMKDPELARDYRMGLEDEAAELAKYLRKGNQEIYHQHTPYTSSGRRNAQMIVKRQIEILKPHMPSFDILTPSKESSMAEYGPVEQALEPSPSIGEEMIPYPTAEEAVSSYVPVSEVAPSYSPIPKRYESRPTYPSLAKVENEDGSLTYKPWNSVYVFVRRVLGLGSQRKVSEN